jgi:hypothetical protein
MIANLFADFERSLEDLGADDLMEIVRALSFEGHCRLPERLREGICRGQNLS